MTSPVRAARARLLIPPLLGAIALLLVLPGVASADLLAFTSPTKNIDCVGFTPPDSTGVSCLAEKASWRIEPRPCDLDWAANDILLFTRKVKAGTCRGDVGPLCTGPCRTLRYGRSLDFGAIRCTSRTNGITCRYRSGVRAGFRIAFGEYRIWKR